MEDQKDPVNEEQTNSQKPAQEEKIISSKERKMQNLARDGDDVDTGENPPVKFRGFR